MGGHSGVGVEKYFGTQGRSSDGALYLVRKCILGNTASATVVTPWQSTYAEKSILNEVTQLQTGPSSSCNRCYFRSLPRLTFDSVIFLDIEIPISMSSRKVASAMLKINTSLLQLLNC